jgi:1-phosphofructokinase
VNSPSLDGRPDPSHPPRHPDSEESASRPRVAVLAPLLYLTVTVESETGGESLHMHPGGQGFWIARMLESLGCDAALVAPIGGEVGEVLAALLPGWGIELERVNVVAPSPAYVHDRRSGDRLEILAMRRPALDRHEMDDFYGAFLHTALTSDGCVLTAADSGILSDEAYGRLAGDLAEASIPVFGDLHGPALEAVLAAGGLEILKVSHEDLAEDGWDTEGEEASAEAARRLQSRGARTVVVSRGGERAIAATGGRLLAITPPKLSAVDHRGAGDSMTGGLTAGWVHGLDPLDAIRLGAAAGAGNVTRRGLGSGTPELIGTLTQRVELEELPVSGVGRSEADG